jgi:glycosyltransferase involved in cell wall biosynthesis
VSSVLAVTSELPWPLDTGGHLRTFHLLRALARSFDVRLVVAVQRGQGEAVAALEANGVRVRPALVQPRLFLGEALRVAAAAARGEPYVLYRRHDRGAVRATLQREWDSQPPDALYLDHLDSSVFWAGPPPVPAVVDLHNVYSTLVRRTAEERRGLTRAYLGREARLLERMERRAVGLTDAVFAVSDEEVSYFRGLGARAVHLVPNGVSCATYAGLPTGRRGGPPTVLYVGAMSWAPNASAARFLATAVLPRVRERFPDARLRVVGRDPLPEVRALARLPGVEVTGTVPSIVPHLAEAHVLAVPLEAGGGTRLKILEAFAAGLPVVSTAVGAEGIRAQGGEHLVLAERDHFADAVTALLADADRGEHLAERARTLVRERYDWDAVGRTACAAVAEAIRARPLGRAA